MPQLHIALKGRYRQHHPLAIKVVLDHIEHLGVLATTPDASVH
jgi:hypothetical protein